MQKSMANADSNVLTPNECGDLVAAIACHAQKDSRAHIAFWLMVGTGLRRNELLALRVEDFEGETVHVPEPLREQWRILPVSTAIVEGITNLRATLPQGLIFPGSHLDSCMRKIQAAGVEAGITKRITCRMLRNTFITLMLLSNVDISVIFEFLGGSRRRLFPRIIPLRLQDLSHGQSKALRSLT